MSKKRQPNSSVVSVMEDETLDLHDLDEDAVLGSENDSVNYMNMDISTDNIEDIVTSKIGNKMNMDDIYMMLFDYFCYFPCILKNISPIDSIVCRYVMLLIP